MAIEDNLDELYGLFIANQIKAARDVGLPCCAWRDERRN
jgi:hypothetical protein